MKETRCRRKYILIAFVCLILISACNLPLLSQSAEEPQVAPGPTVAFQSPSPGKSIGLGEAFPVFVTAADPLGVSRIELWVGDALIMSQPAPEEHSAGISPLVLSYSLVGAQLGTHSMVARAYNSAGVLGESLAVSIRVNEEQSSASEPVAVLYIAQGNETLESIAEATQQSVGAIQQANPGIGHIKPGQHVAIPNAPGGKPPQHNPMQQPGAQIMPGLLPNQQGGAASIVPGQMPQLAPALFPGFQPPPNALNIDLSAPTGITAKASDCKVTLQWADNSSGQTGFTIYRRRVPNDPAPKIIANLVAGTTIYVDNVPGPGKYEYAVEQSGKLQFMPPDQDFIQQDMLAAARSAPASVEVASSAACIADMDSIKHAHIQIVDVVLKHAVGKGTVGAALWYSVEDSPGRRLPSNQGQYTAPGTWSVPAEVVPVSSSLFLNPEPGNRLIVKFWVSGMDPNHISPPHDMGEAYNAHDPQDIGVKVDNVYVAENKDYKVEYKIWIEESKWTGNGTTNEIPAPVNLRVRRTTATSRVIAWDWLGSAGGADGFLLYKSYSCPGLDTQIFAPQMISGNFQEGEIPFKSEPAGCVYRYQVSAFGRQGESAPSNPLYGDTESEFGIAGVTMTKMKFNDLPIGAQSVKIDFYVNQYRRDSSAHFVHLTSYNLKDWVIDGRKPHNSLSLPLGEKEFLTIGYSVSGVDSKGYVSKNSVCTGGSILPPLKLWEKDAWTTVIRSADGACELTVELNSYPAAMSSGGLIRPQADVAIGDVALVGTQVFALLENRGPEPLANNSVFLGAATGYQCQDGRKIQISWWDGRTVSVQSNLPQWSHIARSIDIDFNGDSLEKKEECQTGLFVIAIPPENYKKGEKVNYLDPDMSNNEFFVPFDRVSPIK